MQAEAPFTPYLRDDSDMDDAGHYCSDMGVGIGEGVSGGCSAGAGDDEETNRASVDNQQSAMGDEVCKRARTRTRTHIRVCTHTHMHAAHTHILAQPNARARARARAHTHTHTHGLMQASLFPPLDGDDIIANASPTGWRTVASDYAHAHSYAHDRVAVVAGARRNRGDRAFATLACACRALVYLQP